MSAAWQKFVARTLQGEPDDAFVRLLRQRLSSGYDIVRIQLERTAKGPAYTVLLAHLRQLSTMSVPHSPAFTRMSLSDGLRMVSHENEEQRWAILAAERFDPLAESFGMDYVNLIFLDRVQALLPPRTSSLLAQQHRMRVAPGRAQERAVRAVDAFIGSMAIDLGEALGYSVDEAADILDGALERFAQDHFGAEPSQLSSTG